jgi:hypothetical protein
MLSDYQQQLMPRCWMEDPVVLQRAEKLNITLTTATADLSIEGANISRQHKT